MTLLLLLACAPDDKSPVETATEVDTADSAPDTAVDTTETGESDTAETDTGETESGDSEDTYPYTEWNPGDDVPGWEDADCTEPHPGRTYVIEYPDTYTVQGTFMEGLPGAGPHLMSVRLRDCAHYPCATDSFDTSVPYILADLDATAGDDGQPHGSGEWGPDAEGNRQVVAEGRSMLIDWSNDGSLLAPATVTVCFERVRPDEVRGTVRALVLEDDYPYWTVRDYDSLVYRFPFDIRLPDHSGFDATQPDSPADKPEGFDTAHFTYEQPYDAAWPWDDITDPSVREQIQERYSPYNGL